MKFKYFRLLIAVVVVFAVGAQATSQTRKPENVSLQFGDKTVLIPPPEGLQEVSGKFQKLDTMFKASEPAQNDLLAVYLTDGDRERLERSEPPPMNYYAKIATLGVLRAQDVSSSTFETVVSDFKKNTDEYVDPERPETKQVIENLEQQFSKLNSTSANLEMTKPKNVGVFNVGPNTYSVLLLSSVTIKAGDKDFHRMVLAGASLVYVKNRILFVNCYRTYESRADLETLRTSITKWTKSIVAANEGN
jgi:hypothetical protein